MRAKRKQRWDPVRKMSISLPIERTPAEELEQLVREQATDMRGRRDYWPSLGRTDGSTGGGRCASMEEYQATEVVDEWDDLTFEAAMTNLDS
jgi:hypothetical protein